MLQRGRVHGPLSPYSVAFGEPLARRGYTARSAEVHLVLMARLSRWLVQGQLVPAQLGTLRVEEFLRWSQASGYRFPRSAAGAVPLLAFLRELRVIPEPSAPLLSPREQLLERFRSYLINERGLTEGTTWNYVHAAKLLFQTHDRSDGFDVGTLSAAEVDEFVVSECRARSIPAAKNLINGIRALLRFLHLEGITPVPLVGAVPPVSGWSDGLPRGVAAATVRQLLSSCDRRTVKGSRDFAIMMLLARLGLRAGEVAALDLDDIDWPNGQVLVRGKANRLERLPVPTDVGEALAGYLITGRARCEERAVFLRVLAPHRRIGVGAISVIVHNACKRAGLPPIATHRLRHSVATELLRVGAGIPEIGQLLRQRSAAVTSRYAKVDIATLRQLARPWPGDAQ